MLLSPWENAWISASHRKEIKTAYRNGRSNKPRTPCVYKKTVVSQTHSPIPYSFPQTPIAIPPTHQHNMMTPKQMSSFPNWIDHERSLDLFGLIPNAACLPGWLRSLLLASIPCLNKEKKETISIWDRILLHRRISMFVWSWANIPSCITGSVMSSPYPQYRLSYDVYNPNPKRSVKHFLHTNTERLLFFSFISFLSIWWNFQPHSQFPLELHLEPFAGADEGIMSSLDVWLFTYLPTFTINPLWGRGLRCSWLIQTVLTFPR